MVLKLKEGSEFRMLDNICTITAIGLPDLNNISLISIFQIGYCIYRFSKECILYDEYCLITFKVNKV